MTGDIGIGLAADIKKPTTLTVFRGVELAVEHLNAEGKGRRFVVRTPPRAASGAVEMAVALRDDPSVVGVVGHTDSKGSRDAAPIYSDDDRGGRNAVVAVSPTSTSTSLSGYNKWFFRVCPSDAASSRAVARYVLDTLRLRRASVMYRNDSYGTGWVANFADAYEKGGGAIIQRDPHLVDMPDWRAYVGVVKKTRPDIILFPGSPADGIAFIRALRVAGADVPILGGDAMSELATLPGEFSGVRFIAFFEADRARTPTGRAFVEAFLKKYGTAPDQRSALSYDAAMLIGRAALAVGPSRPRVRDHIANIGRSAPAVAGVTGRIAFDDKNDVVNKPVVIGTVGGGR